MYRFELKVINMDIDRVETFKIEVDECIVECTERDIYLSAMSKAYDIIHNSDKYMFDCLEFISC